MEESKYLPYKRSRHPCASRGVESEWEEFPQALNRRSPVYGYEKDKIDYTVVGIDEKDDVLPTYYSHIHTTRLPSFEEVQTCTTRRITPTLEEGHSFMREHRPDGLYVLSNILTSTQSSSKSPSLSFRSNVGVKSLPPYPREKPLQYQRFEVPTPPPLIEDPKRQRGISHHHQRIAIGSNNSFASTNYYDNCESNWISNNASESSSSYLETFNYFPKPCNSQPTAHPSAREIGLIEHTPRMQATPCVDQTGIICPMPKIDDPSTHLGDYEFGTTKNQNKGTVSRAKMGKKRKKTEVLTTFDDLKKLFHLPLHEAAKSLSICDSTFKKVCRNLGVFRWPYREIDSISRAIDKIEESALILTNQRKDASFLSMELQILKERRNVLFQPHHDQDTIQSPTDM